MRSKQLETVARFLKRQTTLTLSTVAASDGSPCGAPLFYLAEGLRLYWLSSASSRHSHNIALNADAAVSVYNHTADWRKIRGVQMRGSVMVVSDAAVREKTLDQYRRRFRLSARLEPAILRAGLYCFEPEWVRYLDNSRGFGYSFEFAPGDEGRPYSSPPHVRSPGSGLESSSGSVL